VSCSSNEGAALHAALRPRLGAALAFSAALHLALLGLLQAPFGARWGEIAWTRGAPPIRATLRDSEPGAAPPLASAPGAQLPAAKAPGESDTGRAPRALLPESHYYRTKELDVPPGIMTRVQPDYPEAAARSFLSGRVVIRLYISEAGAVERVAVLRAEPPGYFEQSAERAFLAARFSPGMKGGRPVKVQMTLEVSFDSPPPPEPPRG
jgi:TonB family protein